MKQAAVPGSGKRTAMVHPLASPGAGSGGRLDAASQLLQNLLYSYKVFQNMGLLSAGG